MTVIAALRPPRLRRPARMPLVDELTFALVLVFAVLAVIGPWIAPHDPYQVDMARTLQPPGGAHWLGTDSSGRDVLSRLLAGTRLTLLSSLSVVALAAVTGTAVAAAAALAPRWLDAAIMRVCDVFLSLPSMVLALGIAAALGSGLRSTVIAMASAMWPAYARLVRGVMRQTMTATHVDSARVLGVSRTRLMARHILPNSLDDLYVQAALGVATVIMLMSGLAFLGVGPPPTSPDWGAMIADGRAVVTTAWWVAAAPGMAITLAAVAFGLAGDALRVHLDPTLRERR
ncbi:peptide/nickel transport system permease protein [Actinocorallia herbida]|uniref:Peptide/nickel transport system permease protein n=1 Tax=Actinocorallia herbida TaxID=58109 RepID=A0A3N1D0E9_9ACTN|nr:ABC transporter permease [Actinocorallia herbida]ROO86997.1 peptide/nickel transport system permease protein [Actinocorallia herbida]